MLMWLYMQWCIYTHGFVYIWVFFPFAGTKGLTWGSGTFGQLVHGDLVNNLEPKSVQVLYNFNITHVSAGWN
ncbi:putative regulator of chromosome condensation 1/beta-lactamase-inhibitor protein II [Helianthus annuus]|nr:putative regulator of chromosome condensation 1/beta-lactamase-inhibitor protein II [Helianthus annuus]